MNNYEYILASLPVLQQGDTASGIDVDAVEEEIRSQLDTADLKLFDTVADGFNPEKLDEGFYRSALGSGCRFVREYFKYDLNVRNTKVDYLNRALGRPEGTDRLDIPEEGFEDGPSVTALLESGDILGRERGIDGLMWDKVEELTSLHVLDLDLILGFEVRLKIVGRWLRLDPETGREMFRKLVNEIRNKR